MGASSGHHGDLI